MSDSTQIAHAIGDSKRTADIEHDGDATFHQMIWSDPVLKGLNKQGFIKPSPIQFRAIPLGINKIDLMVQSKSGTGKTLVYCVVILERYKPTILSPQSIVLVPTREIAIQVEYNLNLLGQFCSGFKAGCFIGGSNIDEDRKRISKCRSIVGCPGRVLHLLKNQILNPHDIKLVVLDEADKLMDDSFKKDVLEILNYINPSKQMIATSATFYKGLDQQIEALMQTPITVSVTKEHPVLIGMKQYFCVMPKQPNSLKEDIEKCDFLSSLFKAMTFRQCILLTNNALNVKKYSGLLAVRGWDSEQITGGLQQKERTAVFQSFRKYESRILVATDLMSRGIDVLNVDLVVNMEVPHDVTTYLHRIGRGGRFGSYGKAITIISNRTEQFKFEKLTAILGDTVESIDRNNIRDLWADAPIPVDDKSDLDEIDLIDISKLIIDEPIIKSRPSDFNLEPFKLDSSKTKEFFDIFDDYESNACQSDQGSEHEQLGSTISVRMSSNGMNISSNENSLNMAVVDGGDDNLEILSTASIYGSSSSSSSSRGVIFGSFPTDSWPPLAPAEETSKHFNKRPATTTASELWMKEFHKQHSQIKDYVNHCRGYSNY